MNVEAARSDFEAKIVKSGKLQRRGRAGVHKSDAAETRADDCIPGHRSIDITSDEFSFSRILTIITSQRLLPAVSSRNRHTRKTQPTMIRGMDPVLGAASRAGRNWRRRCTTVV